MRNTKLLRTTFSRNVCVFCACRFNGLLAPPVQNVPSTTYEQRRTVTASAPLRQDESSGSAPATQPPVLPDAQAQARAALQAMHHQKLEQQQKAEQEQQRRQQIQQQRVQDRISQTMSRAQPGTSSRQEEPRGPRILKHSAKDRDPPSKSAPAGFTGIRKTSPGSSGTRKTSAGFSGIVKHKLGLEQPREARREQQEYGQRPQDARRSRQDSRQDASRSQRDSGMRQQHSQRPQHAAPNHVVPQSQPPTEPAKLDFPSSYQSDEPGVPLSHFFGQKKSEGQALEPESVQEHTIANLKHGDSAPSPPSSGYASSPAIEKSRNALEKNVALPSENKEFGPLSDAIEALGGSTKPPSDLSHDTQAPISEAQTQSSSPPSSTSSARPPSDQTEQLPSASIEAEQLRNALKEVEQLRARLKQAENLRNALKEAEELRKSMKELEQPRHEPAQAERQSSSIPTNSTSPSSDHTEQSNHALKASRSPPSARIAQSRNELGSAIEQSRNALGGSRPPPSAQIEQSRNALGSALEQSRNALGGSSSPSTARIEQSRNALGSALEQSRNALGRFKPPPLDYIEQSRNALGGAMEQSRNALGGAMEQSRNALGASRSRPLDDHIEQSRNALGGSRSPPSSYMDQSRNALAYQISRSSQPPGERPAEPFDPAVTSNWNILKPKQATQPEIATQPPSDEPQAYKPISTYKPTTLGLQDIDAKFEEYRNRRAAPAPFDLSSISYDRRPSPPVRQERSENRTCLRCGQTGHMTRDCPNTDRAAQNDESSSNRGHVNRERDHLTRDRRSEEHGGGTRDFKIRYMGTRDPTAYRGREDVEDAENRTDSRDVRPRRGFTDAPAPDAEPEQARPRRSGRFAEEVEDDDDATSSKPAKGRGRRSANAEEDDDRSKRRGKRFDDAEEDGDDERPRRRRSRFEDDIEDVLEHEDYEGARAKREERKKQRQAKKDKAARQAQKAAERRANKAEELTTIRLPEFISVANLVQALNVRYESLVRKMEGLGFANHTHDHILNAEEASMIAMEFDFDPQVGDAEGEEAEGRDLKAQPLPDEPEFLPTRPPVVAIMGHVDHGKTTILDFLRSSSVAASEHGGITQHIGAFSVPLSSGKTITFLDTPGHAAFLEMRKRGATVTDIIVLVVAADDGVKPQTIEAIKHAKAAAVPIIVAINKIDKEEADIERVKQDLARNDVEIEDFGGDTQVVPVSGKTGAGIPDLEENISTLSEILDHRADPTGLVEGWVLEATTKKAGRVATVLVRRGTLVPGTIIVAGKTWARVRSLRNEAGQTIMSATPGTPVEVDGWRDQPVAGDEALQAPTEQKAADVCEYRVELAERKQMAADMEAINSARREDTLRRERERERQEAMAAAAKAAEEAARADPLKPHLGRAPSGKSAAIRAASLAFSNTEAVEAEDENAQPAHQTVPFIIKADVSGSVEAVSAYLLQMSNPLVSPTVLRAAVGPVSEFDIEHAAVAQGHIISFNLAPSPEMRGNAERKGVRMIEENVIYRIVGDVKGLLEEKLPMAKSQRVTGEAEVAAAFEIGIGGRKKMKIAGVKIKNGVVSRGSRVRVFRGEKKIYDGTLSSLKNVKKDVKEMRKGTECGMGFDNVQGSGPWEDFEVGDTVQTYEEKMEKRTLPI